MVITFGSLTWFKFWKRLSEKEKDADNSNDDNDKDNDEKWRGQEKEIEEISWKTNKPSFKHDNQSDNLGLEQIEGLQIEAPLPSPPLPKHPFKAHGSIVHENTNLFGKTLGMLVFGLLLPIALLDLMWKYVNHYLIVVVHSLLKYYDSR